MLHPAVKPIDEPRKRHAMDESITQLQERSANMQAEIAALSEELYAQQKEIARLTLIVERLNEKLKAAQTDSGILRPDEDVPPPHY